jgi:hypothetical protein
MSRIHQQSELRPPTDPEDERGGLPIALLAWLIGVPGLIILLLFLL